MNNLLKDIIYTAIIADASGYILGGMKKAHIKAVFKDAEGFPDPSPAIKNGMDRWKKPGLYSSITQFMLITAASVEQKNFRAEKFIDAVKRAPELPDTEYSFFREPGLAEKHLISSARSEHKEAGIPFNRSCGRILPISIPLLLAENEQFLLGDTIRLVSFFTTDVTSAVYSFLFLKILYDFLNTGSRSDILSSAEESAGRSLLEIIENQHKIFNSGFNPDYFIEEIRGFIELIGKLKNIKDIEKGENIICEAANMRLKTPVTRGSVNQPEIILPYALILSALTLPHNMIIHKSSREGGAASALASVASAITAAFYGIDIPDILKENLANKKKILQLLDILASKGGRSEILRILYDSETGLTLKEMEEYRARNKKEPVKTKPGKSRKDKESELTKHIVESWTKIDKAKWRKERDRNES